MGRKRDSGPSISLDSFLDILTCLEGVLMLVIITTGIDAAQTKVIIPTPIEHQSNKKVVYLECRNNMVFPVDVEGIVKATREQMAKVNETSKGDPLKRLQAVTSQDNRIRNDYHEVDMSTLIHGVVGQIALRPNPLSQSKGYDIEPRATMTTDNWVVKRLKELNHEQQRVRLLVRDDSFEVFKTAQRLCYLAKLEVSVEVFDTREPLVLKVEGL